MGVFTNGNTAEKVSAMYLGLLGRSGDPSGYRYWKGEIDAGKSIDNLLSATVASDEYHSETSGLDRAGIVNRIYQNLFNRDADQGGLDFYAYGGGSSVPDADVVKNIANAASGTDYSALIKRVHSCDHFSMNPVTTPQRPILAYSALLQKEQDFLDQIGPSTVLSSVFEAWDAFADDWYVYYGGLNN